MGDASVNDVVNAFGFHGLNMITLGEHQRLREMWVSDKVAAEMKKINPGKKGKK